MLRSPWEGVPATPASSVHQACYSLTLVAWPPDTNEPVTLVGGHGGGVGGGKGSRPPRLGLLTPSSAALICFLGGILRFH